MPNTRLDVELSALEAAAPFLKIALPRDEFENEMATCEQALLELARNSDEIDQVRSCVHHSLHIA